MDELMSILEELRQRPETSRYSDEALSFLLVAAELRQLRRELKARNESKSETGVATEPAKAVSVAPF